MSVKFDVVIPAADAADTLERAAASVLSSPALNKLIIVVDDANYNFAVAQKVALQSQNVRVFHTNGLGPGAARNRGVQECESDWVAFMDADDEFAPGYLEALAELVEQNPQLPMVYTNMVQMVQNEDGTFTEKDEQPLNFLFAHGNRVVDLVEEPHMVGVSAAAAAFNRKALAEAKVKFTESIPWSEGVDLIVRFLLALTRQGKPVQVGICAHAVYRYYVRHGETTSEKSWSDPAKYLLPFTDIYLPWTYLARRSGGKAPVWLQNILIYEMLKYVQADREFIHPSQSIDKDTLARCARLVQQVMAVTDYDNVQLYALTKVPLDQRMMLAAFSQDAPSAPLNGQVIGHPKKPWHTACKYTYFFNWELPVEEFLVDGQPIKPRTARWASHTLFDVEMVRERILWLPAQDVEARLDRRSAIVGPYVGLPDLPSPSSKQAPQAIKILLNQEAPAEPKVKEPQGIWERARKTFGFGGSQVEEPVVVEEDQLQIPPMVVVPPWSGERSWFYMDKTHRAGDNAEVFYRYAVENVPEVKHHTFALSSSSKDWDRLVADGFNLVDADDPVALEQAFNQASDLLLSDISDPSIADLVTHAQENQRIVFLRLGVTRKRHWRWLNPRRVDALITTTTAASMGIVGDGSNFVMSSPEIWQTGMPRHEVLAQLRRDESRRDVLLIAPTWDRELAKTSDRAALVAWVNRWTTDWLPEELLAEDSQVKPVFFVHPKMEDALTRFNIQIPVDSIHGRQLPKYLARSVATVADLSSIADEGNVIGVPSFMVMPSGTPDPLKARGGYTAVGFTLVESLDEVAQKLQPLLADPQAYELPILGRGAICESIAYRLTSS